MNNELSKDISAIGLKVDSIGQFVDLSNGQKTALKLIRYCVSNSKPVTWDLLVGTYYKYMRKSFEDWKYVEIGVSGSTERKWYIYDIMDSYKAKDHHWKYKVRSFIKQWFVSAIGVLVLKNQIVIIPTIELNEEPLLIDNQ